MNKKAIYLFLALLLPGLIFLFLKFFGENKFDIQIYYKDGVPDSVNTCKIKTRGQYYLSDSLLNILKWKNNSVLLIVESEEDELTTVKQVIDDLGTGSVQLVSLNNFPYDVVHRLKKCALFLGKPLNAVLIDKQKRIRGYYSVENRDELDRLEVELKILLEKY
ncbi:MAG: hypothetical protein QM734_11085 [Cyclobacteriaceae bacterium]